MARRSAGNERDKPSAPLSKKAFHLEWKNSSQKIAYMAFEQHDVLFLIGIAGTAKTHLAVAFACSEILSKKKKKIILSRPIVEAGEKLGFLPGPQPLDAKILTPNGWCFMGDLKIGNKVIGRDGKPANIIKIIPNDKKMVYKILTTDNTSTEACENHLWLTKTAEDRKRNYSGSIKSTKEILETLTNRNGKINHFLPRNEPVQFAKTTLPLSPYTLGVLLGDGCITNSIIGFGNLDLEIAEKVEQEILSLGCVVVKQNNSINYNIKAKCLKSKKPARRVRFTNIENKCYEEYDSAGVACVEKTINKFTLAYRCKNKLIVNKIKYEFLPLQNRWANPIKNIINDLNLLGKKSINKFIPSIYKFSSIGDRIELLRGLMDTDGTVKKTGECSYTTTSKQLADDVIELIQSLGGRARINKKSFINGRRIFSKNLSYEFNVSLPNHINPFYISRKASRFKSKYIHGVGIKSIEPVCEKEVQCILLDNAEHLYITDQYIVTHNTFEEKINPYLMPIFDCLDTIVGRDTIERNKINQCMEIVPIAYMRGRTFHDSVIILDEAQNSTEEQLKLAMTRLGLNSKMIITGDPTQSDLKGDVALPRIVEGMKTVQGISVVEFNESHIVRHPLVADILAAWPSK